MTAARALHSGRGSSMPSSEETALWHAFKTDGSALAREQLFHRYLPLARQLAQRYRRPNDQSAIDYDELVQMATTGLLEAIDRFKPELGVPFRYFGNRRIVGSILNGIALHSEIHQQISFRKRMSRERMASLKPVHTPGASLDRTLDALAELAAQIAIGLILENNRNEILEPQDTAPNAYETLAWKQTVARVGLELGRLPERQRDIIRLHYQEGVTFDQLGTLFGLSKGRISQLHKAAIVLLRRRLLSVPMFRLEG